MWACLNEGLVEIRIADLPFDGPAKRISIERDAETLAIQSLGDEPRVADFREGRRGVCQAGRARHQGRSRSWPSVSRCAWPLTWNAGSSLVGMDLGQNVIAVSELGFMCPPDRPCRRTASPRSYQPFVAFTIFTTESMTGTSISTPTTVASAAPDLKPNRLIAAATASS